jgi:hypothetical protein
MDNGGTSFSKMADGFTLFQKAQRSSAPALSVRQLMNTETEATQGAHVNVAGIKDRLL